MIDRRSMIKTSTAFGVLTLAAVAGGGDLAQAATGFTAVLPDPATTPVPNGPLPNLRRCLQNHGFGGQKRTLPTPGQLRGAFRDCAPRLGR